jgi:hypothetical protein
MALAKPPHLTIELYLEHHDCPAAEAWRTAHNENGFPPFKPSMHARYTSAHAYLECGGCGTIISHVFAPTNNELESA